MTFSEKLKLLRVKNEYSQEELADMLNVSRQAITKWENNNGMPDIENIKAIARVFDVTLDSLLYDEEEIESTDESFCFKFAFSFGAIGLILGIIFSDTMNINSGLLAIGFGIIGYIVAYLILLYKKGKSEI